MKSRFYYFKVAFFPVGLGAFFGLITYRLVRSWEDATADPGLMLGMAATVSLGVATLFGLMNLVLRIDVKKKTDVSE